MRQPTGQAREPGTQTHALLAGESPRPGSYVGERYRLDELIGVGGSAQVWRATAVDEAAPTERMTALDHTRAFDRPPGDARSLDFRASDTVAVKLLHPHLIPDGTSKIRLLAEARAVRQLDHPNIVRLRDVVLNDTDVALVFDYAPGGSLASKLRGGPIEPREAASLAMQLADGLEYAHRHGVVHRDVTPGNVLLAADGTPRLADFGIARLLEENGATATLTGTVLGTLRYMAPEQLGGHDIDPRADVYSLGVLLYEMLAGHPPFDARNPVALVQQHGTAPPPLPERVPAELTAIAMACIRRSPAQRPASALLVRDALAAWLDGRWAPPEWLEPHVGTRRLRQVPPVPAPLGSPAAAAGGHGAHGAHGGGVLAALLLVGSLVGGVAVFAGLPSDGGSTNGDRAATMSHSAGSSTRPAAQASAPAARTAASTPKPAPAVVVRTQPGTAGKHHPPHGHKKRRRRR